MKVRYITLCLAIFIVTVFVVLMPSAASRTAEAKAAMAKSRTAATLPSGTFRGIVSAIELEGSAGEVEVVISPGQLKVRLATGRRVLEAAQPTAGYSRMTDQAAAALVPASVPPAAGIDGVDVSFLPNLVWHGYVEAATGRTLLFPSSDAAHPGAGLMLFIDMKDGQRLTPAILYGGTPSEVQEMIDGFVEFYQDQNGAAPALIANGGTI